MYDSTFARTLALVGPFAIPTWASRAGLPIRAGFCMVALARDLARTLLMGWREESVVERGCAAHQLVADLTDVLTQP